MTERRCNRLTVSGGIALAYVVEEQGEVRNFEGEETRKLLVTRTKQDACISDSFVDGKAKVFV